MSQLTEGKCFLWANFLSSPQNTCKDIHTLSSSVWQLEMSIGHTHSDSVWHQAAASKPCVRADVHATEVSTRSGCQAVVLKSHDHWALWRLSLMTMRTVYLMCRHL